MTRVNVFQSHAGSIEACFFATARNSVMCRFQSHAGSIEAGGVGRGVGSGRLFQSHAGSIEAYNSRKHPTWRGRVSIPRWFD